MLGQDLFRSTDGAVAPLIGISLFALVGVAGIAFDYSRMATLDSELQNAADQAALAAASQLDGGTGACQRAAAAAVALLENGTRLANDGGGYKIDVANEATCDATGDIRFYQSYNQTTDTYGSAATSDANANVVEVHVDARRVNFALTPVVGALNSGDINAAAVASLQSAICNAPPLMICNPKASPTATDKLTASVPVGTGFRVTGHGNTKQCQGAGSGSKKFNYDSDGDGTNDQYWIDTNGDGTLDLHCASNVTAWAPGDFGFLEIGDGSNRQLKQALAYQQLDFECLKDLNQRPNTGNPQGLYDAINTRFGIYDFSLTAAGGDLDQCKNGNCPAATNWRMGLVNSTLGGSNKKCGLSPGNSNNGFDLPASPYWPKLHSNITTGGATHNTAKYASIGKMGYPRDLCHYNSYGASCPSGYNGKVGNANWGRVDYFNHVHGISTPPSNITRYQTYLWEQGKLAVTGLAGKTPTALGANSCSIGTPAPGLDRRVLTVAVVNNCAALSGSSTNVVIGEFVDMFLVEPVVDLQPAEYNGEVKDSIYMELIGPAGAGSAQLQSTVRQVPVLIR